MNIDNRVGHRTYGVLETQIWSLLPGFCNGPSDLKTAFLPSTGLARTLGQKLEVRKDLRMHILAAIRQLVAKSVDIPENR